MKKIVFSTGLLIISLSMYAQPTVTFLTFESYTFEDKLETQYGSGKLGSGFQWGAGFEIGFTETSALELIYQNIHTEANYRGIDRTYSGDIGINYLLIGGTKYKPFSDVVSGFGSFDLGVAWSSPSESLKSESVTKFALGGRLGLRFIATEKVSFRIHGQLLSPVQWASGGFYFGTGGGGAGVSSGSTIYQFNVGGSVNFRLK